MFSVASKEPEVFFMICHQLTQHDVNLCLLKMSNISTVNVSVGKRPQQEERKNQDEQKSFFFCPTTVKLLSEA